MCSVIFVQYYMGVRNKLTWTLMVYIKSKEGTKEMRLLQIEISFLLSGLSPSCI